MVLLPIAIALSLIAWPFSEDREGGLMEIAVRAVMVIFFVGISQPTWGFAVDATNAVTLAILDLDPGAGGVNYGFGSDPLGTSATISVWPMKFAVSVIAAILSAISIFLSIFFLLLRWFMVWMTYIGTPLYAVIWFIGGRGPLKTVGDVGATYMRMGVFALLGGPIIAILVLTFQVFEHGGILQTMGNRVFGNIGLLFAELALMILFPVVLIFAVWKLTSWAGRPLGVGDAASAAALTVTALAGGAVVGAVGTGSSVAGSAAGGTGGGAAGGSATRAAGSASKRATSGGASASSVSSGAGGSGLAARVGPRAKNWTQRQTQRVGDAVGGFDQRISAASEDLSAANADATQATAKNNFINKSVNSQTLDLDEANEFQVIPETPAEGTEATIYTDEKTGATMASYQGDSGQDHTVNLSEQARVTGDEKQRADERAQAVKHRSGDCNAPRSLQDTGTPARKRLRKPVLEWLRPLRNSAVLL
jgi:type IV secretion system protein TrbL